MAPKGQVLAQMPQPLQKNERFNDLKEGDMFEVYTIEEYRD